MFVAAASSTLAGRGARDAGHTKSISPFETFIERINEAPGVACVGGVFRLPSGAQVVRGGVRGLDNKQGPGL